MSKAITIHIVSGEQEAPSQSTSWTSAFVHFLSLSIEQLHGTLPHIQVHQQNFPLDELGNEEVVMPILSPALTSNTHLSIPLARCINAWSEKKRKLFFKVVKTPMESHHVPSELRELLGYNFFYIEQETGTIKEYEQFGMLDSSNAFWSTLVDLAYDIIESAGAHTQRLDMGKNKHVYLAETPPAMQVQRHVVRRELRRYGYQVLPDQTLPEHSDDFRVAVAEDLQACVFSIHLIGGESGQEIPGTGETLETLQLELANQHAEKQETAFNRLIWLAPNLVIQNDRQQLFIEELREHADATHGMEIVQVKLEDFKSMLLTQLAWQVKQAANLKEHEQTASNSLPKVYLMADQKDVDATAPLADWLGTKSLEVFWIGHNPATSQREQHIRYLNACDANLIAYNVSAEPWLVTKLQDVLKAPGLGRQKPQATTAILAFDEQKAKNAQQILDKYPQYRHITVIDCTAGIPENQLQPLVTELTTSPSHAADGTQ